MLFFVKQLKIVQNLGNNKHYKGQSYMNKLKINPWNWIRIYLKCLFRILKNECKSEKLITYGKCLPMQIIVGTIHNPFPSWILFTIQPSFLLFYLLSTIWIYSEILHTNPPAPTRLAILHRIIVLTYILHTKYRC